MAVKLVRHGVVIVSRAPREGMPWFETQCLGCRRRSTGRMATLAASVVWAARHRGLDPSTQVDDVCGVAA